MKKNPTAVLLLLTGAAALLVILLIVAGGIAGFLWYRSKAADQPLARLEPKTEEIKEDKAPKPEVKTETKKAPEKTKEPEKKKAPEKKKEPAVVTLKNDSLSPALVRVKEATVHIAAKLIDGKVNEGSGFFIRNRYVEELPEDAWIFVITNAHVLGMLEANAPPPMSIELTLHSGEPGEKNVAALIAGVDRDADLAVLKFKGIAAPTPLEFEVASDVIAGRKVYVAGFPSGRKDRKDVTINETTIAKVNDGPARRLEEIEINGGMSPGTSGGPVVSAQGKLIGIALGAVKDTKIHLAIATDVLQQTLDGKVGAPVWSPPRKVGEKFVAEVSVPIIDPLGIVSGVRLDAWSGSGGPERPGGRMPMPLPGDSQRANTAMKRDGPAAICTITLPAARYPGDVCWLQARFNSPSSSGVTPAVHVPIPALDFDKKPVNLTANTTRTPRERSFELSGKFTQTAVIDGKKTTLVFEHGLSTLLEALAPGPDETFGVRLGIGRFNPFIVGDKKWPALSIDIPALVQKIPPSYVIDKNGKVLKRTDRELPNNLKDVSDELRDYAVKDMHRIAMAWEAAQVPLPNRELQPKDTWQATYPVRICGKEPAGVVNFVLTATYEGMSTLDNVPVAVVTLAGKVEADGPAAKELAGTLSGFLRFDPRLGRVAAVQLKIVADPRADEKSYVLEVSLERGGENRSNIKLPIDKANPIDVTAARVILNRAESLTVADASDLEFSMGKNKARLKEYKIEMVAGRRYRIDVKSKAFETHLRLIDGAGKEIRVSNLAETNVHNAVVTGPYRIQVVSRNQRLGAFQLTVTENPTFNAP